MGKKVLFIFCAFILITNAYSDIDLSDIDTAYHGIWLPDKFIEAYDSNLNYPMALHKNNDNKAYDVLIIESNRIYSDAGFHDRYAIDAKGFQEFKLFDRDNIPHIIDDRNNSYTKIGEGDISSYHKIIAVFLLSRVRQKLNEMNPGIAIEITDDNLFLKPSKPKLGPYSILLDINFFGKKDFELSDYNIFIISREMHQLYGIKIAKDTVYIDQIIHQSKLNGIYLKGRSITSINVYEMK